MANGSTPTGAIRFRRSVAGLSPDQLKLLRDSHCEVTDRLVTYD